MVPAGAVHRGSSDDADIGVDVEVAIFIEIGDPGFAGANQELAPEISLGGVMSVGVEGIHIIFCGGHDEDVVSLSIAHRVLTEIERLRIDVAVYREAE